MRTISTLRGASVAWAIAVLSLTGCASTRNGGAVAQQKPAGPAQSDDGKAADDKKAEERANNGRALAKLERDLDLAKEKMHRAEMAQAHAEMEQAVALEKAEQELAIERRRLDTFVTREVINRVEWAELALAGSADRLQEARDELAQLEKMYGEDDFADGTKEIVLDRGRQRLERSQRDYELRGEDFKTLTERTIPLEITEREKNVREKEQALEKARRSAEAGRLDQAIAIMSARHDIARIEAEIDAQRQKMDKAERADESQVASGGR
jgi:ribosomal protein L29